MRNSPRLRACWIRGAVAAPAALLLGSCSWCSCHSSHSIDTLEWLVRNRQPCSGSEAIVLASRRFRRRSSCKPRWWSFARRGWIRPSLQSPAWTSNIPPLTTWRPSCSTPLAPGVNSTPHHESLGPHTNGQTLVALWLSCYRENKCPWVGVGPHNSG